MTKTKDFTIRITFKDYCRVKRLIKPYPCESMANYFNRIVNKIEESKQ